MFEGYWKNYGVDQLQAHVFGMSLGELVRNNQEGLVNMTPSYQRGLVWTLEQKRKLINSLVVGLKPPSFYLRTLKAKKTGDFYYEMVDGKQRLTALTEFMDDKWTYDGLLFSQVPAADRMDFKRQPISVVEVSNLTDAETVELYERLNFGGVPHLQEQS